MRLINTETKKSRIKIIYWMLVGLFGFGTAAAITAFIDQIWSAL
jgi:hypothetical protein